MKKLGMLIEFDFFDNSQWPGSSPDLNATENLGAILKKHVEDRILKIPSMERNSVETLKTIISEELIKIKENLKSLLIFLNRILQD